MSSKMWFVAVLACACSSRSSSSSSGVGSAEAPRPTAPAKPGEPAATLLADSRYDANALGALTFQLSEGTAEAKAHFLRGLLALHSFWYDEAEREFNAAIKADVTMNMAYWGAAMSRLKLLWSDDDVGMARKILAGMPNPDLLTPREQAWVLAIVALVKAPDIRASRRAFVNAMTDLHRQFPDDESATFLALALLSTTRPEDPDTVDVRRRAAELAATVYKRNPKHPGAAHYLIHAYDSAQLADTALPMAREYASIAPAAFHARHMPAHIFSRLGMWQEAIASCQAAWDASVAAAQREKLSANHHDYHSLMWLVEMPFERGRRADADAALTRFADAVRAGLARQHRTNYAAEVGSYLRRTGEWSRVDELLAPLAGPVVEDAASDAARSAPGSTCNPVVATGDLELAEQIAVLDTRALAASMQRDLSTTKRLLAELDAVRTKLRPILESTQPKETIATLDSANARARATLLARASGNDKALVELLKKSAATYSADTGGESNPNGFVAHEEIAEILLRLEDPKGAAAQFALALEAHPGRARSLLGAARAHTALKDSAAAKTAYASLLRQWSEADATSDGLAEAKAAAN